MSLLSMRRSAIPVAAVVPIAAVAWLFGLLRALQPYALPFHQTDVGGLVGTTAAAGILGGLAAAVRRDRPAGAIAAIVGGVIPTALIVLFWLGQRDEYDRLPLRVLQLVAVIVVLVGVGLGLVAALGPFWLRSIALAPLAAAGWLVLPQVASRTHPYLEARVVLVITLAVVLALGVGRGVRGLIGLVAWPVVVLVVWTVQTLLTSLTAIGPLLRPGFGLRDPDVLVPAWRGYFGDIFTTLDAHRPWDLAIGVAVALVISGVRLLVGLLRRAAEATAPGETKDEVTPDRSMSALRKVALAGEITLTVVAVLAMLVAFGNSVASRHCSDASLCFNTPDPANVTAFKVLAGVLVGTSVGAVLLAAYRRAGGAVLGQVAVAAVAVAAVFLFAEPLQVHGPIVRQPTAYQPSYQPSTDRPSVAPCYSGSGECS